LFIVGGFAQRGQVVFRPGLFLLRISQPSYATHGRYATDGQLLPISSFSN